MTRSASSTRPRLAGAAAILAAVALVGGCSGSGDQSASVGGAAASSPNTAYAQDNATRSAVGSAVGKDGDTKTESGVDVADQKLVRTATLSLKVKDIGEATAKVRAINLAAQGFVLSENIGSYPASSTSDSPSKVGVNPSTYAVLVISVPVDALDPTLDKLQAIGTVLDRHSETENVTEEYVDVQARVTSMKKAVARIQDLIDKTSNIDQLVRLEDELSTRQANLEAIQARLASLERQTARSPITINVTTDPELVEVEETPASGFLGGLEEGWKAFVASMVALLTVLGALLPFVILLGILALPMAWVWRRRRAAAKPTRVYAQPGSGSATVPPATSREPAESPELAESPEVAQSPEAAEGATRGS